jgi:hypothetical protein
MYLSVTNVKPLIQHHLLLTFENNEEKIFNLNPYLDLGKFKELKNENLFNTVKISFDTIKWDNELDLDPEMLYSEAYNKSEEKDEAILRSL